MIPDLENNLFLDSARLEARALAPISYRALVDLGPADLDKWLAEQFEHAALELITDGGPERNEFAWGNFWVLPLHQLKRGDLDRDELPPFLGVLGVARRDGKPLDPDQRDGLWLMADRAALALEDRRMQQRLFSSLRICNRRLK